MWSLTSGHIKYFVDVCRLKESTYNKYTRYLELLGLLSPILIPLFLGLKVNFFIRYYAFKNCVGQTRATFALTILQFLYWNYKKLQYA